MKTSVNKVELNGFLGKDPEYRKLANGNTMMSFCIATDESYKDKNGEWVKNTTWHNVVQWKAPEENVRLLLKKGSRVAVEGKLRNNKYTDKNGDTRYSTDIISYSVEPDETKRKEED